MSENLSAMAAQAAREIGHLLGDSYEVDIYIDESPTFEEKVAAIILRVIEDKSKITNKGVTTKMSSTPTPIAPTDALTQIEQIAQAGLAYVPPQPPPPPIDVLTWWNPKPGKAVRPTFVRVLPDGRIASYYIKTGSGWPMDIDVADKQFIWFVVTENDAKDANGNKIGWPGNPSSNVRSFRYHSDPTRRPKITPRYYDKSQGRILVGSFPAIYSQRHTDCNVFTDSNLGPAESWFSFQPQIDFKGDLGVQDSLVGEWYYTQSKIAGSKWMNREEFFLTESSGWVRWRESQFQPDGTWKVLQDNILNKFIPDNLQVPVFSCNVSF